MYFKKIRQYLSGTFVRQRQPMAIPTTVSIQCLHALVHALQAVGWKQDHAELPAEGPYRLHFV